MSEIDVMKQLYEKHDEYQFDDNFSSMDVQEHPRLSQAYRLIGTEKRLLEIGISLGDFGLYLMRKGNEVTGFDISSRAVEICKKRGIEAYQINIETETFPHLEKFDGILMLEIIEHLIDPLPVLQKLHDVLLPSGFILISTPNAAYIKSRLHLLMGHMPVFGEDRDNAKIPRPYNLQHKTPLTIPNLYQLLKMAGFHVVHIEPEEYGVSKSWDRPGLREFRQFLRTSWLCMFAGGVVVKAVPEGKTVEIVQ